MQYVDKYTITEYDRFAYIIMLKNKVYLLLRHIVSEKVANAFVIPSPTKLQRDIVMLLSILLSVRHILVNTLGSTSFNGF